MRSKEAMPRFFSFLIWSAVFCGVLLLVDVIFVHVPMRVSVLAETQRFYVDFRGRLMALTAPKVEPTIEGLIEKSVSLKDAAVDGVKESLAPAEKAAMPIPGGQQAPPASQPARVVAPAPSPSAAKVAVAAPVSAAPRQAAASAQPAASGYVYADDSGEIHIVERLEQVPSRYRQRAQPLAE